MAKTCYTCRRRRLKCDGTTPSCFKCIANGVKCLGYHKPLVWVGGAAAKGHLQTWTNSGDSSSLTPKEEDSPDDLKQLNGRRYSDPQMINGEILHLTRLNPNFQNLNSNERYLVDYFQQRLCPNLVFSDTPTNPFRRLVAMMDAHPGVLNAAMALAACHRAHTVTGTPVFFQQNHMPSDQHPNLLVDAHSTSFERKDLENVLVLKNRSLRQLLTAISDPSKRNNTAIIATVFMLVILEMWETGWGVWSSHVEGGKKLIENLYKMGNNDPTIDIEGVVASISVFETFGATVGRPGKLTKSLRSRLNVSNDMLQLPITGCPSKIFDAIDFVTSQLHAANMLSVSSPSEQLDVSGLYATLSDLDSFDAEKYAQKLHCSLAPGHMSLDTFIRFCLAWKAAAKIFTSRVIFTLKDEQTHSLLPLVDELIEHCRAVTRECEGIKCFVWPVFIAGVECESQPHREWVQNTLEQFWLLYLGASIKAATGVLQLLWQRMDEKSRKGNSGVQDRNWIKEIYLLNVDRLLSN